MPLIAVRDGCQMHVETLGSGHPVVLIPGLGGSARFWSAIAPALAKTFRVILFDHRGAGRSDRPVQEYRVETLARDLSDILAKLGIGKAHLVGHSTGGAIAQVMALDWPRHVDRLVLSGTWARPTPHFNALFRFRLHVLETLGAEAYARLTPLLGYLPDWLNRHPDILEVDPEPALADLTPVAVAAARIRMLLAFDRSADLARIAAPTLVLGARDDMVVACEQSKELAERIPDARLSVLEGGHFFPRAHPGRFLEQLRFLSEAST